MKQKISMALLIALALLFGTPGDLFAQGSGAGGGSGPVLDELDRPFEEPQPEPEEEPEEEEDPDPEEEDDEVTYFDNKIKTKKLIYIIDRSGSMSIRDQNDTVDGESIVSNPSRLDVAKAETRRSVDNLTKEIEFNVIAFASGSSFGGGFFGWLFGGGSSSSSGAVTGWKDKKLVKADPPNRSSARSWVSGLTTTGATDAKAAFDNAFGHTPKPMDIFFLSDGLPNRGGGASEVRSHLKTINSSGKTRIHTIWIGDDSPSGLGFMEGIAKENGGTFTKK